MNEEDMTAQENKIYESTKDFGRIQFVRKIANLLQENTQLKRMLNIKEKLDKKEIPYEWNFKDMFDMREENTLLKQQLKDKDDKISELELINRVSWMED